MRFTDLYKQRLSRFSSSTGLKIMLLSFLSCGLLIPATAFAQECPEFSETLNTLAHELMHRWGVQTKFRNPDGTERSAAQKPDGGWTGNGESTIQATSNVLSAFNFYRKFYQLENELVLESKIK